MSMAHLYRSCFGSFASIIIFMLVYKNICEMIRCGKVHIDLVKYNGLCSRRRGDAVIHLYSIHLNPVKSFC